MQLNERKLLKKNAVVSEIERYRWMESEKSGYDVSFEKAAENWIVYYALTWLKYHSPSAKRFRLTPLLRRALRAKR